MKKILIISYYELKEYLIAISNIFKMQYKWEVMYYPLYMYCYDKYSKIPNYTEHMSKFIYTTQPDIILWWFTDVHTDIFINIKTTYPNIYYVIYNIDDPINLNNKYYDICRNFDHVLTVCYQNVPLYKINSQNKYIDFMPFGHDPNIFNKIVNINMPDITFICDNLYREKPNQIMDRYKIITTVGEYCDNNKLNFCVYGPSYINVDNISKYYKGNIIYENIKYVAKINLIAHPNAKTKLGLNQHYLMSIMACGGIILMDNINGAHNFFNKTHNTIFTFNNDDIIQQITKIFKLYDNNMDIITQMSHNSIVFAKQYTWDTFVKKIYLRYIEDKFDYSFYRKTYNYEYNTRHELYDLWLKKFNNNEYEIPYKINISGDFDINNYRTYNNRPVDEYTDEYVYIEWCMKDKNSYFIKTYNKNTLSGNIYNTTTTQLFDIFYGFNLIYKKQNIDNGLELLNKISNNTPNLLINNILEQYINIITHN